MNRLMRLRDESGSAMAAAIMILAIITLLGMVILQTVDVQTHQTGRERAGEMAFNFAESALNAEASLLEQNWPSASTAAYPVCTQGSTSSSSCPQGSLATGYTSTYAGSGFGSPTWSAQVIDTNVSGVADPSYYSDSILSNGSLAHWDSNADNKLWIRAEATIGGQRRIVVGLIGRQSTVVSLPQNVVTSGGISTSNNGNKVIIEATDPNSGLSGSVDVRCSTSNPGGQGDTCAGWVASKGQLDPAGNYQTSYVDSGGNYQTLSPTTLNALRQTAQANGTYYAAGQCPPAGTPGLLFIENDTTNPCSYNGPSSWNSDSAPGAIVVATGTLAFNGNVSFYGILYLADLQGTVPTSGPCTSAQQSGNSVFSVHGGGSLHGALFVDKCGTVDAGSSAYNLVYDTKAFGGVTTFATPSLAQNTFRIVSNG
jgi:Tfp pilus assembly protein PilX